MKNFLKWLLSVASFFTIFVMITFLGCVGFDYIMGRTSPIISEEVNINYNKAIRTNEINRYKQLIAKLITKVVHCESGGVHQQWGDVNYTYPAYGIAQFQERTFNYLKELAGLHSLEWRNENDQLTLLRWAIENGYGNYWTCYRNITREDETYGRYFG